ncbi:hypothetical protein [Streptomyces lunalinharesii]|uniref:Uncharacterized protein n=1 Tax=Streptomyces lunalinharesii TaxID=333384 RepID=A0ABP6FI02_9ACTN
MSHDTDQPLLSYAHALSPTPFYAGSPLAEVEITATIPTDIDCTKLVFQLPVGTGKEALLAPDAWKAVQGIKPSEGDWTLDKEPNVQGRFTATTPSKPKGTFAFRFKQITVQGHHGTAKVAVTETSAPAGQTPRDRPASVLVQKVSPAVRFSDLRATPPDVECGKPVTLSWKGSGTAEYTVYYGLGQTAPKPQLKDDRWTTTVPSMTSATTFVVKAEGTDDNETVRNYQSVHVTVRKPVVSVGDLSVRTSTQLFGTPVKHPHAWKGAFIALAKTDGLLLYQPTHSIAGQRTSRVFANVFTDAQLSHTQRRTVRHSAEKPKTPSAICLPVPAGSKIEIHALIKPDSGTMWWIPFGGEGLTLAKTDEAERTTAAGGAPAPRLNYAYKPHDTNVSTSAPNKVTFVLYADAASPEEKLSKLTVTLPVGESPQHLTESLSGINSQYTRWNSFTKVDDHYEADPGQDEIFRITPETLTLADVAINKATGVADIEIREVRGDTPSLPVKLRVRKGAPELKMQDLRADPPTVRRGGQARITWRATALAHVKYELVWEGGRHDVSSVNDHTVKGLRRTTPVTLTAYDTRQNNKVLHSLTIVVSVSEPDLAANTLKVARKCTVLGRRQSWEPAFTSAWEARADTDGLLVLSAINKRPDVSLSSDIAGTDAQDTRGKKEPVTLDVTVTAPGGNPYSVRSLAYDPDENHGDLLPVGIVAPVPRGASVRIARDPVNSYEIESLLTWLPFGAGELRVHRNQERQKNPEQEEITHATVVSPETGDTATAPQGADGGRARLISGFRPDGLHIPHAKNVILSWTAAPSTTLTLVYRDAKAETRTEDVTGKAEMTVRGLTQDTAFTLIASEGRYGTGKLLEVATVVVTVTHPDADFTDLHVSGRTNIIGLPEAVPYTFTSGYTKTNVPTDGFLVGYISDTSASGSKVPVTVTPAGGTPYGMTLYSARSADGATTVPDVVFLPVPKGATLTINASTVHSTGGAADQEESRGGPTASLFWIPLCGRTR